MKYIIVAILCLSNIIGTSQVYRLRTFESHVGILDDKGEEIFNKNVWVESNSLVLIDLKDQKVDIYSNKEMHLKLIQRESYKDDTDKLVLYYTATDKDVSEYKVTMCAYKNSGDKHIATLVVVDQKMKMVMIYHLKKDD
jgi:hypothetical protein